MIASTPDLEIAATFQLGECLLDEHPERCILVLGVMVVDGGRYELCRGPARSSAACDGLNMRPICSHAIASG
jgi:hypothetical protein